METKTFRIIGMHCASCEHVIERKLRKQPGVTHVTVNRMKERATLTITDDFDLEAAQSVLGRAGYELIDTQALTSNSHTSPMAKVWWTVGLSLLFVLAVWFITSDVDLSSFDPNAMVGSVGISSAFILGLIASISSCLAVTGGLLIAITANLPDTKKWQFSAAFGIGRLLAYGLLGGLLGLLGASVGLSARVSAILTLLVSAIMILLGLQLMGWLKVPSLMPTSFAHKIESLATSDTKSSWFASIIGALTFFLPCGFTQALQLYALQSGSFWTGASILFTFALGTLPVLLFVGNITKYITQHVRKVALFVAGIVVIILAIISIPSAMTLYSLDSVGSVPAAQPTAVDSAPINAQGVQEITMTAKGFDYFPDEFTVKVGVPVKWTINGQGATGCAKSFAAPAFGVKKVLSSLEPTIIEFTPTKTGTFKFSCSMGMAGPGTITVIS